MGRWRRFILWLRGERVVRFFDWQPLCFVPEGMAARASPQITLSSPDPAFRSDRIRRK